MDRETAEMIKAIHEELDEFLGPVNEDGTLLCSHLRSAGKGCVNLANHLSNRYGDEMQIADLGPIVIPKTLMALLEKMANVRSKFEAISVGVEVEELSDDQLTGESRPKPTLMPKYASDISDQNEVKNR